MVLEGRRWDDVLTRQRFADQLIQAAIRREFADCTVLTIAHRINTVLDSSRQVPPHTTISKAQAASTMGNRIMVLESGRVAELDEPGALISDPHSAFHHLAAEAGLLE